MVDVVTSTSFVAAVVMARGIGLNAERSGMGHSAAAQGAVGVAAANVVVADVVAAAAAVSVLPDKS